MPLISANDRLLHADERRRRHSRRHRCICVVQKICMFCLRAWSLVSRARARAGGRAGGRALARASSRSFSFALYVPTRRRRRRRRRRRCRGRRLIAVRSVRCARAFACSQAAAAAAASTLAVNTAESATLGNVRE